MPKTAERRGLRLGFHRAGARGAAHGHRAQDRRAGPVGRRVFVGRRRRPMDLWWHGDSSSSESAPMAIDCPWSSHSPWPCFSTTITLLDHHEILPAPSGKQTVCELEVMAIEIVDGKPFYMVYMSIVFCMFTRGYLKWPLIKWGHPQKTSHGDDWESSILRAPHLMGIKWRYDFYDDFIFFNHPCFGKIDQKSWLELVAGMKIVI